MPRLVVLLRHGEALSPVRDPEQGLSANGRERAARTARRLADLTRLDLVEHSDKKRARETAEILGEVLGLPAGAVGLRTGLRPNDDPAGVAAELRAPGPDVALVGHLPFLPRLASLLLHGDPDRDPVVLEDAGALVLRGEGRRWVLVSRLGPDPEPWSAS